MPLGVDPERRIEGNRIGDPQREPLAGVITKRVEAKPASFAIGADMKVDRRHQAVFCSRGSMRNVSTSQRSDRLSVNRIASAISSA